MEPPLRAEPGLSEIGQGSWEGRHRLDIEAADGEILAGWRREPLTTNAPGGERVLDAAVRVREALQTVVGTLAVAHEGETARYEGSAQAAVGRAHVGGYGSSATDAPWTLLVGHDGIFKVVLLALLDLPLERFWTFPFALCGLTVVDFRDGRGILRAHNLVEHLAGLASVTPGVEPRSNRPAGAL